MKNYTTREGWALEVRAFCDPDPRLYISTAEVNRDDFTGTVVNGVPYYCTAHMSRDAAGVWSFETHSRLHMSRARWTGKIDDWTRPARRKLQARMLEIAAEYVKANPDTLDDARREYHAEEVQKRKDRIAQIRDEMTKLSAELEALHAHPARVA